MAGRLQGKRAFVTAAGAGIGRACAIAFAREGASVIATDIDEKALAEVKANGVHDVANSTRVIPRRSMRWRARVGKVDILLNAAGFVHNGTILDCSDEDWDFSFDLNVKSMHRTIKAFLPTMLDGGGGSIVNISSAAGVFKAAPNRYVYSATKAAIAALTRSVAADFVTKGIRCNAICPGTIETPSMLGRAAALGRRRPRDVCEPAADGTARHRRGDRRAGGLSRERRECVHHGRRPHHRWRLDALASHLAKPRVAGKKRVETAVASPHPPRNFEISADEGTTWLNSI